MRPLAPAPRPAAPPAPSVPVLRRACACGGTPGPTGECEACRKKRLQRSASAAAPALAPPIVHRVLRAPGAPLDAGTRAEMEPRFGHSFADVRVHADGEAAASARAVGAHAYTVGRDVVFAAGRYAPGSAEGRRLVAHELAHVVQQRGSASSPLQPRLEIGAVDDLAEREAERAADAVAGERRAASLAAGGGPRLRRVADPGPPPEDLECPPASGSPPASILDVVFARNVATLTPAQRAQLEAFVVSWSAQSAAGDVRVDAYASEEASGEYNWRLSCRRAQAVGAELSAPTSRRVAGIPAARVVLQAHSETTEFGAARAPNRRAAVSTPAPIAPAPGPGPRPPGPGGSGPPRANGAFLDLQIVCVTRLGGCNLPGGLPTPEQIAEWGERCRAETGYAGPAVTEEDLACAEPGMGIARSLERAYPGWRNALPPCPCTDAEARARPELWAPGGCLGAYHPGAASGYRSRPTFSTVPGTRHGQQCCYDGAGRLMLDVAGAGTPDVWSPGTDVLRHYEVDVRPFDRLGWQVYNRYWVPDRGRGCP